MNLRIRNKAIYLYVLLLLNCNVQLFAQSDSEKLFYDLTRNLISKYDSGKVETAKQDIVTLEKLLPQFEDNWNYANAKHKINLILGRIAVKNGEIAKAKYYLIEAGNSILYKVNSFGSEMTFGSPQLRSFGPNMSLAKELLEVGERKIVLEYFEICRKVWSGKIDEWAAHVRNGKVPDFGGNLKY